MKYLAHIIRISFLALFIFLFIKGNIFIWLALFGISLLVALIFGRLYCGYVCPMNTLMIPIEWLSKKLKIQTAKIPKWLEGGYFTWISLGVSVAAMLVGKRLFHLDLPVLPLWLALSVLLTLRYKPEVFHNLVCPFGALEKTFGRFARFSKKVDPNTCIGCKLCEKVCPSMAIAVSPDSKKAVITTALCHQCTNCSDVCPKGSTRYGKNVAQI